MDRLTELRRLFDAHKWRDVCGGSSVKNCIVCKSYYVTTVRNDFQLYFNLTGKGKVMYHIGDGRDRIIYCTL